MNVVTQINVFDLGATDTVRELERELNPKQLVATYGPRCRELTRDHLKNQPDNKKGWPSTGFWEQAARATRWEDRGNGTIAIVVDKVGVRQRWLGGHIGPVNALALTIPISPLSYGKTVKDFPGSFLLRTPKGGYIVTYGNEGPKSDVQAPNSRKGSRRTRTPQRATLIFLFKLMGGVDQKANPDVMPTMAEYRATVFQAARERLASVIARKGGVKA